MTVYVSSQDDIIRIMKQLRVFLRKYNTVFLTLFVLTLSVLYATLSVLRHMHFQSGGFDLGLYDQAVWRFSQFLSPYNTVKERIIFGDHMVLTLPLLAPLFYIWNDVRILLIVQALAIASSAIPIYLIAVKRTRSFISSWAVTILYSLFYGIQFGVFFDFHPIILGVSLLCFLAWALEYKKSILFWIFLLLCLLTQENMGLGVACLGFIYFFRKKYRKLSLVLIIVGLSYNFVAVKISGQFSPVGYQYMPEIPKNIPDFFTRLFDSEEKRLTWFYSYSWFSFLPLLSPGSIMAVIADLSQYYVTGNEFSRMWSPFMHHRAILSVFLTLGLLDVLSLLARWKRTLLVVSCLLLIVSCLCQYHFHFALNKLTKADYWKEEPWMNDVRKLISLVPKDASVATQQNLVPHLSHRKEIYIIFPRQHDIKEQPCGQSLCWWLDFGGRPDYLVVDTRPNQWLTQILESNENWHSAISNMEKVGKITLEKQIGDARMYKINN
jgi:uncharacterized membrane protein